ncbi:MAG: carbohydrate binding family 9 domain-containing protein [Bacteroidetes bacterium]|nr:carbohydrate binding family 9 domain-containing protein [Bacteroidota bacterium]
MRAVFGVLIFSIINFFPLYGQPVKRMYRTDRIAIPPRIDGFPDDSCWRSLPLAGNFTQFEPQPGLPSSQKTEVRIGYDNTAIYIFAMMYEPSRDSVTGILTRRDDEADFADFIAIGFDTYLDGQNAFTFILTAAGVQSDLKFMSSGDDPSWDAVWESKVAISDTGWSAEFKIPFSALRFSPEKNQKWGMNMLRNIRRIREYSTWNRVDPTSDEVVSQFGILENISDITPPLRLSFYPYASAYLKNDAGINTFSFNAGADVKYGISESFTLDATLIPDFGQVRSDDVVLNLSPFEVYYEEQRQFFTEGTELYSKGDIFYSRRIAGTPALYYDADDLAATGEIITANPVSSQLYNATKISGRTKNKTGIGALNATTAPAYAEAMDTLTGSQRKFPTQPLANYNICVLDQSLRYNSYISFINTNVMRSGGFTDANVTGTEFRILNEANSWSVDGTGAVSSVYNSGSVTNGQFYSFTVAKVKGNFTAEAEYSLTDDKYDPNDLGYLDYNNETFLRTYMRYGIYKPFWVILKTNTALAANYTRLYEPSVPTGLYFNINNFTTFANYLSAGFWFNFSPVKSPDFYEPRVPGRFYMQPEWYNFSGYISSDYSKPLAVDVNLGYGNNNDMPRQQYRSYSLGPIVRIGTKALLSYDFSRTVTSSGAGYAALAGDSVIFGKRNISTMVNTISGSYIFAADMSASVRCRHYWSSADYYEYFNLEENGSLAPVNFDGNADISFTAFNIDFVFTWQFAPGSEMSLVWKNSILDESEIIPPSFKENIDLTFGLPKTNSLSLKMLYYLDYNSLVKRK